MPTHPERCPDDQTKVIQAKHKASVATKAPVPSEEDALADAEEFPIGNKPLQDHLVLISRPPGPHYRTIGPHTFGKQCPYSISRPLHLSLNHIKTIESYFQTFQDH